MHRSVYYGWQWCVPVDKGCHMNALSGFMYLCHQALYYSHIFIHQAIGFVVMWDTSQVMDIKPFAHVLEHFARYNMDHCHSQFALVDTILWNYFTYGWLHVFCHVVHFAQLDIYYNSQLWASSFSCSKWIKLLPTSSMVVLAFMFHCTGFWLWSGIHQAYLTVSTTCWRFFFIPGQ